jgi:hypothetical protein
MYTDANGQRDLTHNELRGRISSNSLVVDGEILQFKDLERVLTIREGFQIALRIADPSDELA